MQSVQIDAMFKEGLFKPKTVHTRKEMEKLAKRARPTITFKRKTVAMQIASNLRLLEFQTCINKRLHERGLHLQSCNYYSEFFVVPKNKTAPVAGTYARTGDSKTQTAEVLRAGRKAATRPNKTTTATRKCNKDQIVMYFSV